MFWQHETLWQICEQLTPFVQVVEKSFTKADRSRFLEALENTLRKAKVGL